MAGSSEPAFSFEYKKGAIAPWMITHLFCNSPFCMQEMGLEPTRSHPRQILSLMRLPFRHSCASNSDILSQVSSKFKCLFPTKHYFLVIFQQSVYSMFRRSQSNQRLRSSHAGFQLCGSAVHCRLLLTEVQQSVIYRCSYIPWNVREHQHHG